MVERDAIGPDRELSTLWRACGVRVLARLQARKSISLGPKNQQTFQDEGKEGGSKLLS